MSAMGWRWLALILLTANAALYWYLQQGGSEQVASADQPGLGVTSLVLVSELKDSELPGLALREAEESRPQPVVPSSEQLVELDKQLARLRRTREAQPQPMSGGILVQLMPAMVEPGLPTPTASEVSEENALVVTALGVEPEVVEMVEITKK